MHGIILLNRMGTNKNTYHTAWYEITRLKWDSKNSHTISHGMNL